MIKFKWKYMRWSMLQFFVYFKFEVTTMITFCDIVIKRSLREK